MSSSFGTRLKIPSLIFLLFFFCWAVSDRFLCLKPAECISPDLNLLKAFRHMSFSKVSCLGSFLLFSHFVEDSSFLSSAAGSRFCNNLFFLSGVVENGKLVGNLSASDIKGLKPQDFIRFYNGSVRDFLSKQGSILCVKPDVSFGFLVQELATRNLHRCYVEIDVARGKTPCYYAVVTLTDILQLCRRASLPEASSSAGGQLQRTQRPNNLYHTR